ncbi:MAG: DUF3552 domain-containing protein, partial [Clostridia bacterium]|nr:DUF3552 domain-containing protein [Clostridia bacterium]
MPVAIALIIGILGGYFIRKFLAESKIKSAEEAANKILDDAAKEAEAKKKEAILEAKDEVYRTRTEAEKEIRERRAEIQRSERRLIQKEEYLDRKSDSIERKENNLQKQEEQIEKIREEITSLYQEQLQELERLSNLTSEEARDLLLSRVEEEIQHEAAMLIKDIETQAKEEGEKKAREIISLAIQRCAADHVAETTVSVVALPNDEMKGRIIGREGRNIRTLETM